jgi:hypothetical protein
MIRMADFNIEIKNQFNYNFSQFSEYFCDLKEIDLTVSIDKLDSDYEQSHSETKCDNAFLEYIAIHRKIAEWLPLHRAFVLHSACFDVDGIGVAFAAHSGTGKTTHMRLWQQLLGDKMTIVNGDKPIVRFFDEEPETPYAYGTPWNGKERLGCNMRTPLKHICFIERSVANFVEPMKKEDVINLIFNQVYMPKDPIAVMNTMQLIDRLLSCCNLWKIHCNMEPEAAKIAYDAIFKSESKI